MSALLLHNYNVVLKSDSQVHNTMVRQLSFDYYKLYNQDYQSVKNAYDGVPTFEARYVEF